MAEASTGHSGELVCGELFFCFYFIDYISQGKKGLHGTNCDNKAIDASLACRVSQESSTDKF